MQSPPNARRPVARSVQAILLSALALACATGCASWPRTRTEVVNPIHELLHHTYPEALEEGDARKLTALFEGAGAAAASSLALLASFESIEVAHADIESVDVEAVPVRALVRLQVHGVGNDGALRSVLQDKELGLVPGDAGWRIATDAATPVREVPKPATRFVDEAQLRGLWFQHEGKPLTGPDGAPQNYVFGSGAAVADFDADGWDDVVLVNGDRIELFRNREGYFTRESEAWGLGQALPPPSEGVLTVALPFDYDDDGRRDLFVGAEYAQPRLLRNEGTRFAIVADTGIVTSERTISAAAADFDGDGDVDLYLANHQDVFREAPDPPGAADNAEPDQLFLNEGGGRFRDATREAGLGNTGWALAPVAADYDADGDVDLFVGNDFGDDVLYRNDGTGHFEEVAGAVGVDKPVASMSATWGDVDADGDLDLFVGGMWSGSGWVLEVPQFRIRRVPFIVDWMFRERVRAIVRSWFRGNRLYENQGDGTFREVAAEAGADSNGWSWGSAFLDFDNDGRLDIYASNGFLSGPREDDL